MNFDRARRSFSPPTRSGVVRWADAGVCSRAILLISAVLVAILMFVASAEAASASQPHVSVPSKAEGVTASNDDVELLQALLFASGPRA